jgi:glycerophosphoryl diester phosphodiesterase
MKIACLCLILLFLETSRMDQHRPAALPTLKHPIAVIAHRGGMALAPENTLAAVRNAIRLGVDYVEVDVRATRDGRLILMHDSKVDRTTDGSGEVKTLTLEEIRRLDAGRKFNARFSGEKVPTFAETLEVCRGKVNIYVDVKDAAIPQILAEIRSHGMEMQVIIYDSVAELLEWKKITPHIPVMPSPPRDARKPGGIRAFLRVLPAEVLDGNLAEWTKEMVEEAHTAGAKVYVDNLGLNDHQEGFRRALEMGVDGIQTNYPDRLIAVLKERERTPLP